MKKTMKKTFAVLLTALMLMSVMGMQSFAVLDFLKPPVPVSVEFATDDPLSIKELERLFRQEQEWYEEYGSEFDDEFDINEYKLDIGFSGIPYTANVTFDDGTTALMDFDEFYVEKNKLYSVEFLAYVTYPELMEAKSSGADTLDVHFELEVYKMTTGPAVSETYTFTFTQEKDLVDCFVKSILPVSGFPVTLCKTYDYIDLEGAKLLVTYADGKTETKTVDMTFDEDGYAEYSIDGIDLYVSADEDDSYIEYMDAQVKWNVILHDIEPFAAIEITECDFDAKKGMLNSVSYTIEWKNGKTESYTKTFDGITALEDYIIIDTVDGFYIYAYVSAFDISDEGEVDTSNYIVELSVGYEEELTSVYTVANPNKGLIDFFLAVLAWIEKIKDFFSNFFLGFGF